MSNKSKWINRKQKDCWSRISKDQNYKSRAAIKLIEINNKYKILKRGKSILDIGAAPGGWSQVAVENQCFVTAVDRFEVKVPKVKSFQMDITTAIFEETFKDVLFDGIICDIAADTTGTPWIDHERTHQLNEIVVSKCHTLLRSSGFLCMKIFQGYNTKTMIENLKIIFSQVHVFKPVSSFSDSCETYLICLNKSPKIQ